MKSNLKCPHCGASHYSYNYSMTTAVYYPIIFQNGKLIETGHNEVTDFYTCIECGNTFSDNGVDENENIRPL